MDGGRCHDARDAITDAGARCRAGCGRRDADCGGPGRVRAGAGGTVRAARAGRIHRRVAAARLARGCDRRAARCAARRVRAARGRGLLARRDRRAAGHHADGLRTETASRLEARPEVRMNLPLSRHPSFGRLRAFALGEADEANRRRVARHLERCVRCREAISRVREVVAAARELETPPAGALERIAERRRRGERAVLPVAAAGGIRRARRLRRVAMIAVLIAGGLTYALARTGELEALRSELRVMPAAPRMGEPIRVEYRATSRLADEPRLVLRARFRTPRSTQEDRHAVLGMLERVGDGVFAATVRLPDSAVYAVLAVEDTLARFVDHHGEQWE